MLSTQSKQRRFNIPPGAFDGIGTDEWQQENFWNFKPPVFRPIAVEDPGGGRISDKRDPDPEDTVVIDGYRGKKVRLHRLAADAWRAMVDAARGDGINAPLLLPVSGYRSTSRQRKLFAQALEKHGSERAARRWVAKPGGSAHHSGRAIDLYLGYGIRSRHVRAMRNTAAWRWLQKNAERFGFYPYEREPWHWEYNPPVSSVTTNAGGRVSSAISTVSKLPSLLVSAISRGTESAKVTAAIANGNRDENSLTSELFYARHPERNRRKIGRSEHKAVNEWMQIRRNIVRPMLAQISQVGPYIQSVSGINSNPSSASSRESFNTVGWEGLTTKPGIEKIKPVSLFEYEQVDFDSELDNLFKLSNSSYGRTYPLPILTDGRRPMISSGHYLENPSRRPKGKYRGHQGVDIMYPYQEGIDPPRSELKKKNLITKRHWSPEQIWVIAYAPGRVRRVVNRHNGWTVYIRHPDGLDSCYRHLAKPIVKKGDNVNAGDRLAQLDNKRVSVAHLHFELRLKNRYKYTQSVNPRRFLEDIPYKKLSEDRSNIKLQSLPPRVQSVTRISSKVVRLNRYYGKKQNLGWHDNYEKIERLLGFINMSPSEEVLAEAVAAWQRTQGLKPDGVIGPKTWMRMQAAIRRSQPSVTIDLKHAVSMNRHYGRKLGWHDHYERIERFLGFTDISPSEEALAAAVASWQRSKNLKPDGVIGPKTWMQIQKLMGLRITPKNNASRNDHILSEGKLGYVKYSNGDLKRITPEAVLWLAKMIDAETWGKPTEDDARSMLWALVQRTAIWNFRKWSWVKMIQAYSQPINPRWTSSGDKCSRYYKSSFGGTIPEKCSVRRVSRRIENIRKNWEDLHPIARRVVLKFIAGKIPNHIPGAVGWFAPGTWKSRERNGANKKSNMVYHSTIDGNVYFMMNKRPDTTKWTGQELVIINA